MICCPICTKWFKKVGSRKYCSPECSTKKHAEQLAAQLVRRRKWKDSTLVAVCRICEQPFKPKHARHYYCSPLCQDAGILAAVERQRKRREEAKERRKKSDPPA